MAAVSKRLENRETVVLAADGLEPAEREPFVRMAAALKRPRHLILLETARDRSPRRTCRRSTSCAAHSTPASSAARAFRRRCASAAARPARSSGSCSARRRARSSPVGGKAQVELSPAIAGSSSASTAPSGGSASSSSPNSDGSRLGAADHVVGRAVGQQAALARAEVDRLRVVGDERERRLLGLGRVAVGDRHADLRRGRAAARPSGALTARAPPGSPTSSAVPASAGCRACWRTS